MKENTLIKISLIFSLVGLLALFLISSSIEPKVYQQFDTKEGDDIRISGKVMSIEDKETFMIVRIESGHEFNVIVFNDGKASGLRKGDEVEIIGSYEKYKGSDEVIADAIRKID